MTVFWINLIIVFIFSLLARYIGKPVALGPTYLRSNKWCAFVALASLVLVSGLRSNIGDTEAYIHSYNLIETDLNRAITTADFGFNILSILLKNISSDPQLLIFVTALIINLLVFKVIYTYANPFELGTFLYITTGSYLVSMNGLRQFLASAIVFSAINWLIYGKWKRYFLIVLFAATLHLSALIMIPVYFVARQKAWSRTTISIMLLTFIIFVFFKPAITILFNLMGDNQYAHYRDYLAASGLGANIMRVIIAAVPLILAFLGRVRLRNYWPESDYIVNLSMINFIFMLFASYNWIFARFAIYFGLYNFLLLPWIIKCLFNGPSKRIMYFSLLLCYIVFYYYENVISLGMIYKSNYINF